MACADSSLHEQRCAISALPAEAGIRTGEMEAATLARQLQA